MKYLYSIFVILLILAIQLLSFNQIKLESNQKELEAYNKGYIQGRQHAFSEAVVCYGCNLPYKINTNYPCEK